MATASCWTTPSTGARNRQEGQLVGGARTQLRLRPLQRQRGTGDGGRSRPTVYRTLAR